MARMGVKYVTVCVAPRAALHPLYAPQDEKFRLFNGKIGRWCVPGAWLASRDGGARLTDSLGGHVAHVSCLASLCCGHRSPL